MTLREAMNLHRAGISPYAVLKQQQKTRKK
jgi:hypothetical protein